VPTCRIIRLWCGDFQAECGTSTSTFTSAWRTLLRCNLIKWSAAGMGCKWQVPRGCCKKAAADQARLSAIVVRPHAGNGGCYEVGHWYMVHGYGIGYTTEDICVCTMDDTCGISRLKQGSLGYSFIWQPTRPHNYRYRLDSTPLHAPKPEPESHLWLWTLSLCCQWIKENSLCSLSVVQKTCNMFHTCNIFKIINNLFWLLIYVCWFHIFVYISVRKSSN